MLKPALRVHFLTREVENQKDGRRQSNFVDCPSDSVKLRNLGRVVVDGSLAHWSSQTLSQS